MAIQSGTSYFPDQAGLHSNIFRPPRTPGSRVDSATYASTPALTRKRSRTNSIKANTSASLTYGTKDAWTPRGASPPPLANTQYTLAGGFDTPTLGAITRPDDVDDLAGERGFRGNWDTEHVPFHHDAAALGPLARERNGKARMVSTASSIEPSQSNGWGKFVMNLVGGVAEKMWYFCRESAFRGFYAGSGEGFDFNSASQLSTPLPGQYPSNDFFGDFEQDNTPPSRPRPAKRQHTETGSGWVMVDHSSHHNPDPPRLSARKVSSGNLGELGATRASSRRPMLRPRAPSSRQVSYTGSPQPPPRLDAFDQAFINNDIPASTAPTYSPPVVPASTASTYSPAAIPASTASTRSPAVTIARSSLRSPITMHHRSNSKSSRAGTANGSPMTPEAQIFLNKKDKQNRDADKSMRKMSRQVQDLIRQGQAALGTKFEVQSDADDDADDWEDAAAQKF